MRIIPFCRTISLLGCLILAKTMAACAGEAQLSDGQEEVDAPVMLAEMVDEFRKHCVRVYIHGKTHGGKAPSVGDFAADIRNERPTPVGGYWWDEKHVVIRDFGLHDRFVRSIEIGLPHSDRRFPARIAGRFIKLQAVLLEVLPDDEGEMPEAHPIEFVDGNLDESAVLGYVWEGGDWRVKADNGLGASAITDAGVETLELGANGVFMDEGGGALGLAFGDKVTIDGELDYWCGRELPYTGLFTTEDRKANHDLLKKRLDKVVVETRFRLRVQVDDEDSDQDWSFLLDDDGKNHTAEIRAAGIVVGERHVFVPLPLLAEGIARIEEITLHPLDGGEIRATFVGAFREYMAVLIEAEKDIVEDDLPPGFSLLNPLVIPEEAFAPESEKPQHPTMEYIQRWRIDYALGRRRQIADYDRWLGTFRGYRGDTVVSTMTSEEDGSLAFDVLGNLSAVAVTPRVLPARTGRDSRKYKATPGFRPLEYLSARFHSSDVFDPALAPAHEEAGKRLVDFGVEYQGLDANTARLFTAAEATRGGKIGLLVTHVYPGSLADESGIREHDVLLRMTIEGKTEPTELSADRGGLGGNLFEFDDISSESLQQLLAFMPPPWPQRDNAISSLLTGAGVGRSVSIEYLREGEPYSANFTTKYTSPDYRNAKPEKFQTLGLTVKPVTYEVARYYRRPEASGVIISKVEEGGKAAVAGLYHYLLVTHVDGRPVDDIDDFRTRIEPFEDGANAAVELTVEGFGKTRLVKIE